MENDEHITSLLEFSHILYYRFNGIEMFPDFEKYSQARLLISTIYKLNKTNISQILTTSYCKSETLISDDSSALYIEPNIENYKNTLFKLTVWTDSNLYELSIKQFLDILLIFLINNSKDLTYPNIEDEIIKLKKLYFDIFEEKFNF